VIKKVLDGGLSLTVLEAAPEESARVMRVLGEDPPAKLGPSPAWLPLVAGGSSVGAVRLEWEPDAGPDPALSGLALPLGEFIAQAFNKAEKVNQLNQAVRELRSSRQQLFHSRNTLRALFDSSPASIYIVDRDFNITAVNLSRASLAGQPPQKLVGRRCYTALFQREHPCVDCAVEGVLAKGAQTRRIEQRKSYGDELADLEISAYPVFGEGGAVHQAFLFEEDVTERRRLEASLVQAEKLAAVGQLAAGVAHEVNNPLTAILANAELLLRALPPGDRDQREMAETIVQAAVRASQSVRDLLDFSRLEPDGPAAADLNESIRKTLSLIRHELQARTIGLTFLPEEGLPPVAGRRDQLQSVWLNLIVNARQSIEPSPGEIRIATRRSGDTAEVTITDTGVGIRPDQLERIFEPFYTTKDAGLGTGLGLSICRRIVTGNGGDIRVSSQLGRGTQVTVTLPLVETK
jgi:PAS domain S-box-containing protein